MRRRIVGQNSHPKKGFRIGKGGNLTATATQTPQQQEAATSQQVSTDAKLDPFHSGKTPVCKGLHDAVCDVFPELRPHPPQPTPTPTKKKQQDDSKGSEAAAAAAAAVDDTTLPSLFGQFIRWKLLAQGEERRRQMLPALPPSGHETKAIKMEGIPSDPPYKNGSSSAEGQVVPPSPAVVDESHHHGGTTDQPTNTSEPMGTTEKKKKKRKKKKKKQEQQQQQAQNNNDKDHPSDENEQQVDDEGQQSNHHEHHQQHHQGYDASSTVKVGISERSDHNDDDDDGKVEIVPLKTTSSKENGGDKNNDNNNDDDDDDDGDDDDMESDKLLELLENNSEQLLLPITDDNKSVDSSIEAMDQSVRSRGELLKKATAKQRRKSSEEMLQSIPSEENGRPLFRNNGGAVVSPDEDPSEQRDSVSSAAGPNCGQGEEEEEEPLSIPQDGTTTSVESRLFHTSPLDMAFLIGVDGAEGRSTRGRHSKQLLSLDNGNVNNDREEFARMGKSSLEIPILGKTPLSGGSEGHENMEITRALLEAWVDEYLLPHGNSSNNASLSLSDEDWESFVEFCNQRTAGQEMAVGIPVHEVIEAVKSIECQVCRPNALTELDQFKRNLEDDGGSGDDDGRAAVLDMIVLDPSHFNSQTEVGIEIEDAYAYHELEEGHHLPRHHRAALDANLQLNTEENISFVAVAVADPKPKRSINSSHTHGGSEKQIEQSQFLFLQKLTSAQITNFVRDWLPYGIDEEAIVGQGVTSGFEATSAATSSNPKSGLGHFSRRELVYYQRKIQETCQECNTFLEEMDSSRRVLVRKWEATPTDTSNWTSHASLFATESKIMEHTGEIITVLCGPLSETSHMFADLQLDLWATYLGGLSKILKTSNAYYAKLRNELSDQNTGHVPDIFISATRREAYHALFGVIVRTVTDVSDTFRRILTKPLVKEWETHVNWHKTQADDPSDESKELDKDCRELVDAMTKWIQPLHQANMEAIKKERNRLVTVVSALVNYILIPLADEYCIVQPFFSEEKDRYFTDLLQHAKSQVSRWQFMMLPEGIDHVFNMAAGVLLMWRHVRIMQSRMITSASIPPMPLPLRQWMLQDDGIERIRGGLLNDDMCWRQQGGGGKRKFTSIVAGLGYVWLRERCSEWKAEKAELELLTNFELEVSSASVQRTVSIVGNKVGGSKSSKKSKKKKTKNTVASTNESKGTKSGENAEMEGLRQDESIEVVKQDDVAANDGAIVSVEHSSEREEVVPAEEPTGESSSNPLNNEEKSETTANAETAQVAPKEPEEPTCALSELNTIDDYGSKVVLYDDDGTITVKEFLIQRFNKVMVSGDNLLVIKK